jgi:glyoxalase family protein
MGSLIKGIHHITGVVTDPQRDYDFYTKVMGLRFIKKTVNQENPVMWHFFYGDHDGNAGTIMTNIIIDGGRLPRCTPGRGSIETLSYSVPKGSLDFWSARLKEEGYKTEPRPDRFGDSVLYFEDPDELPSELIACDDDRMPAPHGDIPSEYQIRGFHGATIISRLPDLSLEFFTTLLGFEKVSEEGDRIRLAVNGACPGHYIDFLDIREGPWAKFGMGAIHHISFTVDSLEQFETFTRMLGGAGLIVTEARDRGWFHSMYFTEPGGINLELSNMSPGWTVDEDMDNLGQIISLPNHLEPMREKIEASLPEMKF